MPDDNLPVGPAADDPRLPARSDALPVAHGHGPLTAQMLAADSQDDRDEIDLLAYWRILVKRRWLILGIVATGAVLSLLATLMTTPLYRSTAIMQIDNEQQEVMQLGGFAGSFSRWDPEFLETQYQLLRSRALAERVVDDLDLDATALARLRQPGWLDRLKGLLRPQTEAQQVVADPSPEATRRAAIGVVRGGLSIEPVMETRLVRISYDSPVPAFSAQVANAVAEGFIAAGLERRFGANSYARQYLEDQLKTTKSRLEQSERQLVDFARKENLVSSGEGSQSLAGQNLAELNSALATAQEQRIRAEARWSQARSASGAALPADMLGNSIVRTLQQQRAELQGSYQQKLQVYKPDYPQMLQLKRQMDDLDKQIGSELANIRASVKAEYDAATAQESLLRDQLAALRTQALDVDSRSIDYNIIKREVDTNRQLYDSLLQRYKEVGVAGNIRANNVSIIDRAQAGSRFKPVLPFNLGIGLLLGALLGVVLAFVLEFLDDTLKTPEDIEQRLKLAVLGIIPKLAKQSPEEASRDPRSAFSESYRSARTALQFSTNEGVPKVLLVTSAGPGEGKSTTALALARNFAQMGRRVLLIEGDLRNPSLRKIIGVDGDVGLSNLLSGSHTVQEAVLDTRQDGLKAILAGPLPPNPAELLSGSKLVSLLTIAAEHYDQVIIDGPPVLGIADAPILANAAGGTVLVVHSGKTRINTAQATIKRLLAARARLVGCLLTRYDARAAGHGYNYEGYYAYGGPPQLTKR
jgi:capsular exopolysaccharide synthesis family protein